jgi:hypothetical protein
MNYTVIQTDLFKHIFESFWNKWKLQKNNFKNKLEWCEQTKIKIKSLTIGVSKKLNITETKLKIWETTLEKRPRSGSLTFNVMINTIMITKWKVNNFNLL